MKKIIAIVAVAVSAHVSSVSATPNQYVVPESQKNDFGITCWDGDRQTYSIHKNKENDYRHARNIVFTDLGGGRVAISLLHGRGSAETPATYLTSSTERCETYQQ